MATSVLPPVIKAITTTTGAGSVGSRLSYASNTDVSMLNGMTAGVGLPNTGQDYYENPKPHEWTYGGGPKWQPARAGVMRNLRGTLKRQYSLYFIFNPNEITASFVYNYNNLPTTYSVGNESQFGAPNYTNAQSVSWSLLFDRTYDMMYGKHPDRNRGVLRDVAALYLLLGAFENSGGVPISPPLQVIFGQTDTGQLWGFTGFITALEIDFGIFRYDMIPSRCEVDLTMTAIQVAQKTPAPVTPYGTTGIATAAPAYQSINNILNQNFNNLQGPNKLSPNQEMVNPQVGPP